MGEAKKLFINSFVIFVGTTIASIFSYLFNMTMGRMLGPSLYGSMTALFSLIIIVSSAGAAILTITMKYSGELYAGKRYKALSKIFKIFTKYVFFFGVTLFLIGLALSRPIANFLSIESTIPIIIIFLNLLFGLVILVNKGILQGTQHFLSLSVISIIEASLKFILGVLLVKIGYELNGAVGAIVLATLLSYFITFWPLKKILLTSKKGISKKFNFSKKELINYSWPTLFATVLLAIALNLDIILVKHFFSPFDAGLYAAISTIAKIVFYVTGPIVSVMFPMISESRVKKKKHYNIFFLSLLLTLIGALFIVGAYTIAPGKIISVLYGSQYIDLFYLLPEVGLVFLFFSLINLVVNYFMAVKNFFFIWFLFIILILQIVLISLFHPSLLVVVRIQIITFCLMFISIFGYYLFTKKDNFLTLFTNEEKEG